MSNIIASVQCSNEWVEGFKYAFIPITKELAQKVLSRRKTFLEAFAKDDALADFAYWDYSVNYFESDDFDEDLDPSQGGGEDYVEAPENFKLPDTVEGTECDQMVIGERGVYWSCYPKHVDNCKVNTMEIPYHEFEKVL